MLNPASPLPNPSVTREVFRYQDAATGQGLLIELDQALGICYVALTNGVDGGLAMAMPAAQVPLLLYALRNERRISVLTDVANDRAAAELAAAEAAIKKVMP